jgi:50S ribosomal protein L16 3-hydroxylase
LIPGGAMDSARFLREFWQQQPLLIPAANEFTNPLDPEELAGLALEPGVEARLVRQRGDDWHQDPGPLEDSSFAGDEPWTLLVQRVDHYVPEVAALRRWVDFLPGWRLDDIMVSYATDGGGVGPHYDNYDVFLVQGAGQRRWQLGQRCDNSSPLRDNPDLRILEDFEESASYLLNPGDILYVPPGLAHWGTSAGTGMTYSIGFRAPRLADMLSRWVDELLPAIDPEQLYSDPQPLGSGRPGELTDAAVAAAREQLRSLLEQDASSADWFGELVTETAVEAVDDDSAPLPARVVLDPAARLAWREDVAGLTVYANGLSIAVVADSELLAALCRGDEVDADDSNSELLNTLWDMGCLLAADASLSTK